MRRNILFTVTAMLVAATLRTVLAAVVECQCDAANICPEDFCCSSKCTFCSSDPAWCTLQICQSQCSEEIPPTRTRAARPSIADIVTEEVFEGFLPDRNDEGCPARGLFTYSAFLDAAKMFPAFGTEGEIKSRKREVAAFFGHSSHVTAGGYRYPSAKPYCYNEPEGIHPDWYYCDDKRYPQWPCTIGKKYHWRGPLKLEYSSNYGMAGEALGLDLLSDPHLVAKNATVSFQTAVWLWMTPQRPQAPSCHDVMIGNWTPTDADISAKRLPGFGLTISILTGYHECPKSGFNWKAQNRIDFYKHFCSILGISPGENLRCAGMVSSGRNLRLPREIGVLATAALCVRFSSLLRKRQRNGRR